MAIASMVAALLLAVPTWRVLGAGDSLASDLYWTGALQTLEGRLVTLVDTGLKMLIGRPRPARRVAACAMASAFLLGVVWLDPCVVGAHAAPAASTFFRHTNE